MRNITTTFILFASAVTVHAKSDLDVILRESVSGSPQVTSQARLTDIARGDRYRRFWLNEPQFTYSNADDNNTEVFGVTLAIPFPGRLFASTQLDAAKARAQESELRAKRIEIAKMIAQAGLDCAVGREMANLQAAVLGDNETVSQSLRRLYEAGHATQAEKIGAELQVRQARLDLRTNEEKAETACRKFASLTEKSGAAAKSDVALPDDLDGETIALLGSEAPDQLRAQSAIETAELARSTALSTQLPDLTLAYNRNHYLLGQGSPNGKDWTTTYSIAMTIPIFFFTKESVEISRTKAQALMDLNTAQVQKLSADSDVEDAAREFQRSRERLKELRAKDLALAEALVESTASAYRAGKLGYAELVLSRKTLSDLHSQDIQLRSAIVLARLRCLDRCEQNIDSRRATP